MMDGDRWLRRVWLVNGVLLLALFLWAGAYLAFAGVSSLVGNRHGDDVSLKGTGKDSSELMLRAVRFSAPQPIHGTDTRLVEIFHGAASMSVSLEEAYSGMSIGSGVGEREQNSPRINVLFLRADGTGRLLFQKPVIIKEVDFPRPEAADVKTPDPTLARRNWIAYVVVSEDTNDNGRLDADDRPTLYVSDLAGQGLHPVLGERMWPDQQFAIGDGSQMLVYALEPQGERKEESKERMRQRALLYDAGTGKLQPYAALDSLTREAARVVAE